MKRQQRMHNRTSSKWTQHPDDTACGVKEGHKIAIAVLGAKSPLPRYNHGIIENAPMPQYRPFGEASRSRGVLNLSRVIRFDRGLLRPKRFSTDGRTYLDHLLKEGWSPSPLLKHA